jgi:hypothetical protein
MMASQLPTVDDPTIYLVRDDVPMGPRVIAAGYEERNVARLPRRLAAMTIDLSILTAIGAVLVGAAGLSEVTQSTTDGGRLIARIWRRGWGRVWSWWTRPIAHDTWRVIELSVIALAMAAREWRTPGARTLRLRWVQTRNGKPVGLLSAAVFHATLYSSDWLTARATAPLVAIAKRRRTAQLERLKAIEPELDCLAAHEAEDPTAAAGAKFALYREHRLFPIASLLSRLPRVALRLTVRYACYRPGQNTFERLAGTVWVLEPKGLGQSTTE